MRQFKIGRRFRLGFGSVAALAFVLTGFGYGAVAYVAQLEPEAELLTSLPLARI